MAFAFISADRPVPSTRQCPVSRKDRTLPPTLSGSGGRRLSALLQPGYLPCSGLATVAAFRLRRPGPFQAIPPAFIDLRSGLSHQPDASVRVASRSCGSRVKGFHNLPMRHDQNLALNSDEKYCSGSRDGKHAFQGPGGVKKWASNLSHFSPISRSNRGYA
jgi:hypothetical protein